MAGTVKFGLPLLMVFCAYAQDQVKWDLAVEPGPAPPGAKVIARMTGHIDTGWHIYSMSTAAAIPTTIQLAPNSVVERYRILQPQPKRAFDSSFGADTETYDGEVAFLVELQLKKDAPAGPAEISVTARYQTCNDVKCIPPVRRTATAQLNIDPAVQAASAAIPSGYAEPKPPSTGGTTQDQGW